MLFILLIFSFFQAVETMAQCPPADSISKVNITKKISFAGSDSAKLAIMLSYRNVMINCRFKKDSTYAWLIKKIGTTYYYSGSSSEALPYFQEYINFYRTDANKSIVTDNGVIDSYYFISMIYDGVNNVVEKRKATDSCIIISERSAVPYNPSCIRCLSERIQYFYDIGEYKLCINDAEKCEKAAKEYLKTATYPGEIDLGQSAIKQSFHWRINALIALYRFLEVEKLLANKAVDYAKAGSKDYLALTYTQLASVLETENKYEESLADLKLALKLYKENKNNFSCKQTLNKIGQNIYFNHFKDYDKAIVCFKDALLFVNHNFDLNKEDSIESLSIYGGIANIFIEKGLFDSGFYYFRRAMSFVKKGADINYILNSSQDEFSRIKKIEYLSDLLINYSNAYKKKYKATGEAKELAEAILFYTKVDKFLARINVSQYEQDSRLSWRKDARRLYENAIEACYLVKNSEKAFYFFERSRATLLNIQLAEQNWLAKRDISELDYVKKEMVLINASINELPENAKKRIVLRDSLSKATDKLYNLEQSIKIHYPLYYQNLDTFVMTIPELRNKLLADHHAVFEIFSGDSCIYSLLVTDKNAVINKIDKPDFETTANRYTAYLSDHNVLNKDFGGFIKTAHHLYELVLQNNQVPQGRIIISPDGYYFPFESLITNSNQQNPVYFILDHAVSYTYSVRFLFNNFGSSETVSAGNFLGVAPVNYAPRFHLPELTGSDLSLNNIERIIGKARILLAQDASKENFLRQFRTHKIAQLYTHSSDSSERNEPVIYFNDSAVYLSELLPESKPVTELIVLSACETSNGQLYQGEGVFSFNRAFAALGIPSSISNIWSIDSKSTFAITESFYKYLADGLPLDVALQKAKLEYMSGDEEENQLPYYWAAAVLVGKSDPISLQKPFPWAWLFFGAGLLGGLYAFMRIVKNYQKRAIPTPDTKETAS
ncbi:MAG: CHAT domain-containing protein [Bacteroidetes bacterium]|nr:CHAT domain-containing protein [Bacteroidota bacterium]